MAPDEGHENPVWLRSWDLLFYRDLLCCKKKFSWFSCAEFIRLRRNQSSSWSCSCTEQGRLYDEDIWKFCGFV